MKRWLLLCMMVFCCLAGFVKPVQALENRQVTVTASDDQAVLQFPDAITFSVKLQAEAEIQAVVLEYWVEQLTCGNVIAKAYPDFTSGKEITLEWSWDMRQSGSLPPGATLHWQWRVTDAAGIETVTDAQTALWLDDQHPWQTISEDQINLHWYDGGNSFGKILLITAVEALARLEETTGLKTETPIDLYIYANTTDMAEAILYEPGWTGGIAFPENNIVIIGIEPANISWGKDTEAHELTHVLIGQMTFGCLGFVPTWLNEGIAMYGEGGPDPFSQDAFEAAIANNTLMSVRSLSGGFSEAPNKADISYSQSYSLVNFLIEEYGKDKILELFKALQQGSTTEDALQAIYGFGIDGLEDAWRAAIMAEPRPDQDATEIPPATVIPTYPPAEAVISATPSPTATFTPTSIPPTSTVTVTPVPPTATALPSTPEPTMPAVPEPSQPTLILWVGAGAGVLAILVIAGLVVIVAVKRKGR